MHGITKVELVYVHAGRFVITSGDDVVDDELGASDVGGTGGLISRVFDEVTSECHAGAICFFLLGLD